MILFIVGSYSLSNVEKSFGDYDLNVAQFDIFFHELKTIWVSECQKVRRY